MEENHSANPVVFPGQTHWFTEPEQNLPENFVPIRLVLLPSDMAVDIRRTNVMLGRHSEADIRLPLPDVSRRHCRLIYRNDSWHIVNLQSLNGVYVNDQAVIDSQPVQIGDRLRLGGYTFRIESLDDATISEAEAAEGDMLLSISRALPRGNNPPHRPAA